MYLAGLLAFVVVSAIVFWLRSKPQPITLDPEQPHPPEAGRPLQLPVTLAIHQPPAAIPPPPASPAMQRAIAFDSMIEELKADYNTHTFPSKIAGVSYRNDDGSSRQSFIRDLNLYDELELAPEPDNRVDPYAVAVFDPRGNQLGYLPARTAKEVVSEWADGSNWLCWVLDLTGEGTPTCGVNLLLMVHYTGKPGK